MNLTLWRPFSGISPFRRERDNWIERFFEDTTTLVPALDLKEDEDKFTVQIELPGVEQKDVSITLKEDVLTIQGEKKTEKEEKTEQRTFTERSYGSFSRSLRLPASVDSEKVTASFDKGILEILLPKAEEAKPKSVKIKAA